MVKGSTVQEHQHNKSKFRMNLFSTTSITRQSLEPVENLQYSPAEKVKRKKKKVQKHFSDIIKTNSIFC